MKKKLLILAFITIFTVPIFSGCGTGSESNQPSFEEVANGKLNILRADSVQAQQDIEALKKDVEIIKDSMGLPAPEIQQNDIVFSSVKVVTPYVKVVDGKKGIYNSFNLKIDLTNTSSIELKRYYVQVILRYELNGNLIDVFSTDSTFDCLAKNVRSVEIDDIKLKGANVKHSLIIRARDSKGNTISTFNSDINVL